MSFSFGSPTTTTNSAGTFGTTTTSTGAFPFGSGDAKPIFGAGSAESKPAFNFTSQTTSAPAFGGFSIGANKTTPVTTTLFAQPATTTGAKLSFPGFTSPPNQTVGGPGFGQPSQNAAQNLSFGGAAQQQQAPAFGTPTTQAGTGVAQFGTPASSGFSFGQPATATASTGFTFSTPVSKYSPAPLLQTSATPSTVPQTTQASFVASSLNLSGSSPGFGQTSISKPEGFGFGTTSNAPSFGTTTAPPAFGTTTTTTSFRPGGQPTPAGTFSMPTTQAGLSFGTTKPAQTFGQTAAPTFGTPTALGFGTTQTTGLSFETTTVSTSQTGLGYGTPATQTGLNLSVAPTSTAAPGVGLGAGAILDMKNQTGLGFGAPAPTAAPTSLAFGTPATSAAVSSGMSFGTLPSTAANSTGLGFGTPASTAAPATGLSFGTPASTSATAVGLGFAPNTSMGLGFGTSTAASSAATTSAGLGKSTAPTILSLTTATTTTASVLPNLLTLHPPPFTSVNFAQLEENINKWTLELEEQEKTFINQATQINAWDRLLIANGEKIVEVNDAVETVKNEQQSLEHELDFVLAQQKELEEMLAPIEKQLLEDSGDRMRDPGREHMYSLAENLDTQLRQMSEDLKEVIEHINESNRCQDSNDLIVQIGRILNAHMSSMQWIDNSIAQISTKLDHLKATHDTLRRENERSFQLTYN